jgi:molybdate transport repressor ModE-like protein
MKTGALILAAGKSSDSEVCVPLYKVGAISAIQRLILTFNRAKIEDVVVVFGDEGDKIERHVGRMGVVCLHNPNFDQTQMFDSTKIGFRYLVGKCDQALVTPVDVPLFTLDTVRALIQSGEKLAAPVYNGERGHPILVAREQMSALMEYEGGAGLLDAAQKCGWNCGLVDVEDPGILIDVIKNHNYKDILDAHSLRDLHVQIKLSLMKEEPFFGAGSAHLLAMIENTGSVRMACQQVGLSYSKAWQMIALMEKQWGMPIVHRQQGGKHGGEAHVTPMGKELLERFRQFEKSSKAAVEELFHQYF